MELKDYQIRTLEQVKSYLTLLSEWKSNAEKVPEMEIDFAVKAWEKAGIPKGYHPKKDGLDKPLPNFCLKIPTGGGKTLLAVKTIDLINQNYLKKQTGLVLWIVPTTQIYRQTIKNLKDKGHPYRQHLDLASGGRTTILEKSDHFSPQDLEENLVVMMLMLQSSNRQTKEALKVFKDNGFSDFFPLEDDIEGQAKVLEQIPNLDTFGEKDGFWGRQIKTSLGNVLRLCQPIMILDEGHKAYSDGAQATLRGFNPSILIELSATPPEMSNILVDIPGIELNREEMIKLDLHVVNKASADWKDTILEAINKRENLETKALEYEANSGQYIRPICVIQVERTGKDQRGANFIHSENVKEFLVSVKGISPDEIAIKTSEKDELREVDDLGGLMSRECKIRYIITKQALQEGWDCPFAYVLAILTNPTSQNALTQLVGRILRQPYARKIKTYPELDESYVYCFQQSAGSLLGKIKKGFEDEGLGDLYRHVSTEEGFEGENQITEREYNIRERFQKAAKDIILPVFVVREKGEWREVDYQVDLVSQIDWSKIDLESINNLKLSKIDEVGVESIINIIDDRQQLIERREFKRVREEGMDIDLVFVARYLIDVVPNPWVSFEIGKKVFEKIKRENDLKLVISNFVFIVEELKKHLISERDRLAEDIFKKLVQGEVIRFLVIGKNIGYKFPPKIKVKNIEPPILNQNYQLVQRSLFDFQPLGDMNETERSVALSMEEQDKMFFWYRNRVKTDYGIQGWRKQKVYPDFIFTTTDDQKDASRVFVMELKGEHLLGSDDSEYKKTLLNMCTDLAKERNFSELGLAFKDRDLSYEFVDTGEWRQKLNEMVD
ncbi:MAG: DEAD/DEAH box helicase family protein [Patescibacteria group bacterium]